MCTYLLHNKSLFILCFVFASWITCIPAFAQKSYDSSPKHDIILAYHKMAGKSPDFQAIAKEMRAYKDANDKEDKLKNIAGRLRTRFNDMDAGGDILTFSTKVKLDAYRHSKKGKGTFIIRLLGEEPLHFSAQSSDKMYAILPEKFHRFRKNHLWPREINAVLNRIPSNKKVKMYLQLQPKKAKIETPYILDGKKHWLLMARVARIGLYNDNDKTIWEYKAKWHSTKHGDEVRGLFRK